jgi:hypothetical protein
MMASPVAIKSSVSLSFSGSNGGRGLGKPGGKCGLVVLVVLVWFGLKGLLFCLLLGVVFDVKIIAIAIIITLVGLIISLNIGDPIQPNTSVFDTSNTNTTPSNKQLNTQSNTSKTTPSNKQNNNNPFNPNQTNATNTTNPHFPPGFPKPLPPLDPEKLKETDDLIATGDAIVAKMNELGRLY